MDSRGLMIRVYERKTGKPKARKDKLGTILLQFLNVVPQEIGISVEQGIMLPATPPLPPSSPIPTPTPIHDDEPGKHDIRDLHLDLRGSVPHDQT